MERKTRSFASVSIVILILALECSAQDKLTSVVKQYEPQTITLSLEFSKKNQSVVLRALSVAGAFDPNAHATGFLVGEGLVMTSYHVVSGKLSSDKKKVLGFKPGDELQVKVFVDGSQAKVVKVDEEADLALLKVRTPSKRAKRPMFRKDPSNGEQLLLIAQPGNRKMIRWGSFNGLYTFRGQQYWSVKIDGQDGFSGSPVYNSNGEIVGVFCLYDWKQGVALLSPGEKVQQFLAEYDADSQNRE